MRGEFSGLVTAPVNKAVINQQGISFSGHTEFLAQRCGVETVVMMLACPQMKVALVTTHLPLKDVPQMITKTLIIQVVSELHQSLQKDFGIPYPKISVAGLNPHAGEAGYLGHEEIDMISPALHLLKQKGMDVSGPFPADTMFTGQAHADAFVTMYHDQGLPVLKYAGFGQAVNVTLGLPIIRTSVDHGTALDLAGKGLADSGSLMAAIQMAASIVHHRTQS
jgi:4-hydroxythreonine-4-phosphate dehydrogenase